MTSNTLIIFLIVFLIYIVNINYRLEDNEIVFLHDRYTCNNVYCNVQHNIYNNIHNF